MRILLKEMQVLKQSYIHSKFNINVFADDTGLEVQALKGKPGVHSARFAGNGNVIQRKILQNFSKN